MAFIGSVPGPDADADAVLPARDRVFSGDFVSTLLAAGVFVFACGSWLAKLFPDLLGYLARRFPGLAQAPLLSGEVCQYENTSSGDFLIDRHPDFENVRLAGGGSGHGFKHGPSLGEYVAGLVTRGGEIEPRFRLETKATVQTRAVH